MVYPRGAGQSSNSAIWVSDHAAASSPPSPSNRRGHDVVGKVGVSAYQPSDAPRPVTLIPPHVLEFVNNFIHHSSRRRTPDRSRAILKA